MIWIALILALVAIICTVAVVCALLLAAPDQAERDQMDDAGWWE